MAEREELDELKATIPMELVIEVLGGEIRHTGRNGKTQARCPFHGKDRHPSAVIFPDGTFYCSTCSVKGDIFDIVIHANVAKTFAEAVEWLTNLAPGSSTTGN